MYNVILSESQKKIFDETSEFVKSVDKKITNRYGCGFN
jgi:hypothetical protein